MKPFGLDKTIPNTFDMYENEKKIWQVSAVKKITIDIFYRIFFVPSSFIGKVKGKISRHSLFRKIFPNKFFNIFRGSFITRIA